MEVNESTVASVEPVEPQVSGHIEKAMEGGWKPLEEWDGDPEDWVDAKTFNQRGEYMERIKAQSSLLKKYEKKLSKVEAEMQTLAEHHRKVAEIEREKALNELKDLKRQALDLGDSTKVVEIDDKIDDIKRSKIESPKTTDTPTTLHPEVVEWIEENPWYESDKALQGAANAILEDITNNNPELKNKPAKVLAMMKEQLEDEFPNKFKRRTSAVAEPSNNDGSKKSGTEASNRNLAKRLTEEQRQYAAKFIKVGAVKSYEEYAKQLNDIGAL